jgi:ankyrin repeat protein
LALAARDRDDEADIATRLLDGGAEVDVRGRDSRTPLMYAALRGNIKVVRVLLHAGADVNARNNDGSTALTLALEYGHKRIVELLIKTGAEEQIHERQAAVGTMN